MNETNYQGYLLASNPANPKDDLYGSVIIILNHSEKITVGLQLNNKVHDVDLQGVAHGLGIAYLGNDPVYYGGNMATNKLHVVHSLDWMGLSSVKVNDHLAVTNDISIIAAISRNEGPEYFKACAGFWMWETGHLDLQMDPKAQNVVHRWEAVPATVENVFSYEEADQWYKVLEDSARYQINNWF